MKLISEIKMLSIDLDSLADTEENPETVIFDVQLSGLPNSSWVEEFEFLYKSLPFEVQPPVVVDGDRLHVHYIPRYSDYLQAFIEHLAGICHRATLEARLTEKMKTREDQERRKKEFRKVLQTISVEPAKAVAAA
jgi:hypothetical protein